MSRSKVKSAFSPDFVVDVSVWRVSYNTYAVPYHGHSKLLKPIGRLCYLR